MPLTVHPGIGYDIIANHPMFNGAVIGRAAEMDFRLFGAAVEGLDGGVVLNIGSAIMGPQVFEKSISCVNNLRLQAGRGVVRDHTTSASSISKTADNGTGARASRPRRTPRIISGSARAFRAWAGPCATCRRTMPPFSITFFAN